MLQEDYQVNLEGFCGPLDLLLFLIRRAEVDVRDIPIADLTDQYLAFLRRLDDIDIDIAGEFLVMAATLVEIKSRTAAVGVVNSETDKTRRKLAGEPREVVTPPALDGFGHRRLAELDRGRGPHNLGEMFVVDDGGDAVGVVELELGSASVKEVGEGVAKYPGKRLPDIEGRGPHRCP